MKSKSFLVTTSIVALGFLVACSEVVPENWLLKVGNSYITNKNIEIGLQNLPLETRRQINEQNQQEVLQRILNESIQKEILYQEALAENIEGSEDFQQILERLNQQYEFQKETDLCRFLLRQKADTTIEVTNEEALKLYNENIKLFQETEERNISHILVANKQEADKIYDQLYKGSAKFNDLAKSKSIHTPSAKNGGEIGYIRSGTILPEIETVAFSLQKVAFAKPTQSELGWHIVKLNDIRVVPARSYDEVKELIANELAVQKTNKARLDYYNSIKDKYVLEENKVAQEDTTAQTETTTQN